MSTSRYPLGMSSTTGDMGDAYKCLLTFFEDADLATPSITPGISAVAEPSATLTGDVTLADTVTGPVNLLPQKRLFFRTTGIITS